MLGVSDQYAALQACKCGAAIPVKEHLQALLRLAWCKGGHNTAPGLPLTLVNQC